MAKHDRITVTTTTGQTVQLIARGSGATVEFTVDRVFVVIAERRADKNQTIVREARVAIGAVVTIVTDRTTDDPPAPRAKVIHPERLRSRREHVNPDEQDESP